MLSASVEVAKEISIDYYKANIEKKWLQKLRATKLHMESMFKCMVFQNNYGHIYGSKVMYCKP